MEAQAEEERKGGWRRFLPSRKVSILAAIALVAAIALYFFVGRSVQSPTPAVKPAAPVVEPAPPPPLAISAPEPVHDKPEEKSLEPEKPAQEEVSSLKIEKRAEKAVIDPMSARGYKAMMAKDLFMAQRDYARLASRDPQNREALIGLAAVAIKKGEVDTARRYYRRMLEIDPEDPVATAGLVDLGDAADGESRLRSALQRYPDAASLYFSLGNRYAVSASWAQAHQAYSEAYQRDAGNADYAFNLAVSLDHLGRVSEALNYYRIAVEHAEKGWAGFSVDAAKKRMRELGHAGSAQ